MQFLNIAVNESSVHLWGGSIQFFPDHTYHFQSSLALIEVEITQFSEKRLKLVRSVMEGLMPTDFWNYDVWKKDMQK